ncbi:hypothetical protein PAXY110619_17220 [Paenibacillus xylanexedens]|uniref:Uncharacterized protein n=1 Tax=Paenibacillus xylanexedens TaxID=528191 RepID=A0ABS4S2C3_PAEXY|nr:hypothetical protein [Paenibacillus xylanexedens]
MKPEFYSGVLRDICEVNIESSARPDPERVFCCVWSGQWISHYKEMRKRHERGDVWCH